MHDKKALVIAPFGGTDDGVVGTIHQALHAEGLETNRLDEPEIGAGREGSIIDAIRSSDLVIADLTQQNPNVFYELGYAHALRKPTILLVSTESRKPLPNALKGFFYIAYDPHDLDDLAFQLRSTVFRYAPDPALSGAARG